MLKWFKKQFDKQADDFDFAVKNDSIPKIEETLPPKQYNCEIDGHSWSNWKTIVNEPHGFSYWKLVQQRTCSHCNKVDVQGGIKSL